MQHRYTHCVSLTYFNDSRCRPAWSLCGRHCDVPGRHAGVRAEHAITLRPCATHRDDCDGTYVQGVSFTPVVNAAIVSTKEIPMAGQVAIQARCNMFRKRLTGYSRCRSARTVQCRHRNVPGRNDSVRAKRTAEC